MAKSKAPMPWYGGKQALARDIIAHFPPHTVYVEPFGGAASVLFAKAPAPVEVYNDLDSGLVNFFRVLRSREQCAELCRLLELTPYSREEWDTCRKTWQQSPDPVEMARAWYVALVQSFSKTSGFTQGWSYTKDPSAHTARKYRGWIETLPGFTSRLARVQVEHAPALNVIRAYDSPATLFYLDPPYVPDTRGKGARYAHEMSHADHTALLEALQDIAGMAIVSGYRHDLYDTALAGWHRVDMATFAYGGNSRKSSSRREARTECLWLSPRCEASQLELWSA